MLVMLDLDNTLGDRMGAVTDWVDEFLAEHSLSTADREWILEMDNDGYSDRVELFKTIRDRCGLRRPVSELVASYRHRVVELTRPTEGARECLVALRSAGHDIAIVTNGSSGQQHAKVDALNFRHLVDAVIVSGDLDIKKPDPRIYQAAADAVGQDLRGSWMVGDSPWHDIVGAQMLDVSAAWLHRGRSWPAEHAPPAVVIDDLMQFVSHLRSDADNWSRSTG